MGAIIYAVFGIIEVFVVLRFIFKMLGANPDSGFVALIYNVSAPLVAPFIGIFGPSETVPAGAVVASVFEWASLVAIIVYGLVGGVLSRFLSTRGRRV